jgi:hypothetical protein
MGSAGRVRAFHRIFGVGEIILSYDSWRFPLDQDVVDWNEAVTGLRAATSAPREAPRRLVVLRGGQLIERMVAPGLLPVRLKTNETPPADFGPPPRAKPSLGGLFLFQHPLSADRSGNEASPLCEVNVCPGPLPEDKNAVSETNEKYKVNEKPR